MRHNGTDHHTNGMVHREHGGVTIRRLDEADAGALRRLAGLDSAAEPRGAWLGAEVEGRLLAATSLEDGRTIADPFARTSELRALLELRATQLGTREGRRAHGRRQRRRRGRRPATLAGSPPGAGGRLVTLPLRPH